MAAAQAWPTQVDARNGKAARGKTTVARCERIAGSQDGGVGGLAMAKSRISLPLATASALPPRPPVQLTNPALASH